MTLHAVVNRMGSGMTLGLTFWGFKMMEEEKIKWYCSELSGKWEPERP